MKVTFFIIASLAVGEASHLLPRLAPPTGGLQALNKTSITANDKYDKNFTHNELFTLQKKFLDNFVAPNNAVQVRFPPSNRTQSQDLDPQALTILTGESNKLNSSSRRCPRPRRYHADI